MKQGQIESKYKYMLGKHTSKNPFDLRILTCFSIIGEPSKEKFEGIILSDAATESNFIRSNGIFTAVSSSV